MSAPTIVRRSIEANGQTCVSRRRAFTLAEILLTLAILVIISALVWPTLRNTLAGRRLQSAVDAVRSEWCQARVQAMRSGRTYVFRYLVGGDRFQLGPQDAARTGSFASPPQSDSSTPTANAASDSSTPAASSAASTVGEDRLDLPSEGEPAFEEQKSLPEGIRFVGGEAGGGSLAALAADDEDESLDESGDAWSEPVLFYPDGTTSNARIVLAGKRGGAMQLELRGITGTVTVSDSASVE